MRLTFTGMKRGAGEERWRRGGGGGGEKAGEAVGRVRRGRYGKKEKLRAGKEVGEGGGEREEDRERERERRSKMERDKTCGMGRSDETVRQRRTKIRKRARRDRG